MAALVVRLERKVKGWEWHRKDLLSTVTGQCVSRCL